MELKRFFLSLLAILMVAVFIPGTAYANPAPPLTNLQIIGVTSDGENGIWEEIEFNQQVANIPLSGTTGYLAVYVQGTIWENDPLVYKSGERLQTTNPIPSDWVIDSSGRVIGEIVYYEFELSGLTSGRFTVSASDYYPPHQTRYDHLYIYIE